MDMATSAQNFMLSKNINIYFVGSKVVISEKKLRKKKLNIFSSVLLNYLRYFSKSSEFKLIINVFYFYISKF